MNIASHLNILTKRRLSNFEMRGNNARERARGEADKHKAEIAVPHITSLEHPNGDFAADQNGCQRYIAEDQEIQLDEVWATVSITAMHAYLTPEALVSLF